MIQREAIEQAFKDIGGVRTIKEIKNYVQNQYGDLWKDFGTIMADMVSKQYGGNASSTVPNASRVLKRVARGKYTLI